MLLLLRKRTSFVRSIHNIVLHKQGELHGFYIKRLARAAFGGYFAFNGIHHFRELKHLTEVAEKKNVQSPRLTLQASGVLLIASGPSSLGLGNQAKGWRRRHRSVLGRRSRKDAQLLDSEESQSGVYHDLANFSKNPGLHRRHAVVFNRPWSPPRNIARWNLSW